MRSVYDSYIEEAVLGIVKIDDALHEEVRKASAVMCRSINAQAEFWMKIGRLAEANPALSFNDIICRELASVQLPESDARAAA
jgi:hypothetical protein